MQYTNDIIFDMRCKKDESFRYKRHKRLKQVIKRAEDDGFFALTIVISFVALFIDFLMIKQFIEVIKIL